MQCYASTKIKNRQGKSIEDLPVAKDGHAFNFSRRVTECNNECHRYMAEWRCNDVRHLICKC
ncbi:hypothetical protein BB552_24975 [Escherichia coli]|nr:hypothetical protein [Escherichia coli]PBU35823.1 hypothetical protein BB547_28620 [Escherichia coli]PBU43578.1 hypothetical protein BB545_16130 [Escherichia coli]PBU72072.1 hypothetical protein BB552_24975 [Escherichia coli]PBU81912.1 hypothetical protein BB549_01720 [Escherichia coli]